MNWRDPQHYYYLVGILFFAFSIFSIYRAQRQYRIGLRQRTAESLMELEQRLNEFREILPLVDPESGRYERELRSSVEKSIQKRDQSERLDDDRAKILLLDRFLRFLLLLTALQEYELLKPDALRFMYWYWFKAINQNSHLRLYVDSYFPTLATALDKEPVTVPPENLDRSFIKETFIQASPERVFKFHEEPDVLSQLTPSWAKTRVVEAGKISEVGSRTVCEVRLFGVKRRWIAQHTSYVPPRAFSDVQIKGPFRRWCHRHLIYPTDSGARLVDEITYQAPFGVVGRWLSPFLIDRRLRKLFDYRHEVTRRWCEKRRT